MIGSVYLLEGPTRQEFQLVGSVSTGYQIVHQKKYLTFGIKELQRLFEPAADLGMMPKSPNNTKYLVTTYQAGMQQTI